MVWTLKGEFTSIVLVMIHYYWSWHTILTFHNHAHVCACVWGKLDGKRNTSTPHVCMYVMYNEIVNLAIIHLPRDSIYFCYSNVCTFLPQHLYVTEVYSNNVNFHTHYTYSYEIMLTLLRDHACFLHKWDDCYH